MENVVIGLRDGLRIGENQHLEVELREVTAGDMIEATTESEKLVDVEGSGPQLVSSPTLTDINTLRRQIVRVGDHKGPLTLAELKLLSAHDFKLINSASEKMASASR